MSKYKTFHDFAVKNIENEEIRIRLVNLIYHMNVRMTQLVPRNGRSEATRAV